jgi:predicted carbohydrate-binding protein with CBM5 and CBM33 domain
MELSSGPAAAAADAGTVAVAVADGELAAAGEEVAATGGAVTA